MVLYSRDVNHVELCDIFMCPSVTFRLLPSGLYSGKFTYQGMLYELSVFVFVLFCLYLMRQGYGDNIS